LRELRALLGTWDPPFPGIINRGVFRLVATLLFGGNNDQEALVVAKCMSQHGDVSRAIIRFILLD